MACDLSWHCCLAKTKRSWVFESISTYIPPEQLTKNLPVGRIFFQLWLIQTCPEKFNWDFIPLAQNLLMSQSLFLLAIKGFKGKSLTLLETQPRGFSSNLSATITLRRRLENTESVYWLKSSTTNSSKIHLECEKKWNTQWLVLDWYR